MKANKIWVLVVPNLWDFQTALLSSTDPRLAETPPLDARDYAKLTDHEPDYLA
jgi:hypothetical protein